MFIVMLQSKRITFDLCTSCFENTTATNAITLHTNKQHKFRIQSTKPYLQLNSFQKLNLPAKFLVVVFQQKLRGQRC